MDIIGLDIDGVRHTKFHRNQTPTWFFRLFMFYCIDNHIFEIDEDVRLHEYFSSEADDPVFGTARQKNALVEYEGIYFSTYNGTSSKIGIMVHLANLLGIEFQVFTI